MIVKGGEDQIRFVPGFSKVGGDASHSSHRVIAPMALVNRNDHFIQLFKFLIRFFYCT